MQKMTLQELEEIKAQAIDAVVGIMLIDLTWQEAHAAKTEILGIIENIFKQLEEE